MTKVNYAYSDFNDHTASAYGRSLHISTKASINICKALRYKSVDQAIRYLDDVIAMKRAIPFTRFTDGVGHRRGDMAAGRYPIKAAALIRDLIKSAASNAENKGFSEDLKIVHLCAQKASSPTSSGRHRRSAKRTHIEVVVKERNIQDKEKEVSAKDTATKKNQKESPKQAPKESPKKTVNELVQVTKESAITNPKETSKPVKNND